LAPAWTPDGRHIIFTLVVGPFDLVNAGPDNAVATSMITDTDVSSLVPQRVR